MGRLRSISGITHRISRPVRRLAAQIQQSNRNRAIAIAAALALLALVIGWGTLLTERPLDQADPVAVASRFIQDVRDDKPNHAYQLMTDDFRSQTSLNQFTNQVLPDATSQWPDWTAVYKATTNHPGDAGINDHVIIFVIPSDGQVRAQQAMIRVKRGDQAVWRVESISSITHINGKIAPGAQ